MYGPGALVEGRLEYSDNGTHLQLKDSIVTKQRALLLSLGAMIYAFFASEIASITAIGRALATLCTQRSLFKNRSLYVLPAARYSRCDLPTFHRQSIRRIAFFLKNSLWSFCNKLTFHFVYPKRLAAFVDWEYMILAIVPSCLASFLLSETTRPLESLLSFTEAIGSISYPRFIEEVRSERYKDWKKDEWSLHDQVVNGQHPDLV